jgi:formylglycine-generating enzyme required for sulfatase activity
MTEPIKVFISYSHQDDALKKELCEHLWSLQHRGLIQPWNDREIEAGMDWEHEINENLARADIVLMLVSSSFISSRYCYCIEMDRALERHQAGTAKVIPVIIRACSWTRSPLGKLQGFPADNKAVASNGDKYARDPAWVQITEAIERVAKQIQDRRVAELLAVQKTDAQEAFRVIVQSNYQDYYENGSLDSTAQRLLEIERKRLGLEELEAREILQEIESQQQQYRANLAEYREELVAKLAEQAELTVKQRKLLQQFQSNLNISNEEAQHIERDVLASSMAERQKSQPPKQPETKNCPPTPESINLKLQTLSFVAGIDLPLVYIPGGTFQMGSAKGQGDDDEKPQHLVTVPAFLMGKYPVTQLQWRAVAALPQEKIPLKDEPSHFLGDSHPVERVSWNEAEEFCRRLSRNTDRSYRLPSEAEWEYACRAGTTTEFYFGDTLTAAMANHAMAEGKTLVVGSYQPNAFGLYDLHGNVWEWGADHWHNNYQGAPADGSVWIDKNDNNLRLIRGGSWSNNPTNCRAASRVYVSTDNRGSDVGFRLVCAVFPGLL